MSSMKSTKIILFDFDGVILNTEYIYLKIFIEYNKKLGIPISKEIYIDNFLGKTKKEISAYLKNDVVDSFEEKEYWKGLYEYLDKYIRINDIKIQKGFLKLKKYLDKNNYKYAIVSSNSKESIKKLLKKANINIKDFYYILSREDVINTKPNPDLYLKAINYFDNNKEDLIAIEDSNVGIEAALNAGLKVINFKDIDIIKDYLEKKCYAIISSLEEVIDIIKEMK